MFFQAFLQRLGSGSAEPERFLNAHIDQLSPSAHHVIQGAGIRILERASLRTNRLGKRRQYRCINQIRFGQLPRRFRKIPGLAGIDHHDGQGCRRERGHDSALVPPPWLPGR